MLWGLSLSQQQRGTMLRVYTDPSWKLGGHEDPGASRKTVLFPTSKALPSPASAAIIPVGSTSRMTWYKSKFPQTVFH